MTYGAAKRPMAARSGAYENNAPCCTHSLRGHTPAHGQRADEETVTVATRPGVNQAFLLVRPPGLPLATVVVLVGGTGKLDLTPRALLHARGVFVPRRKQLMSLAE